MRRCIERPDLLVGPFEDYCAGASLDGGSPYITAPLIGLGIAPGPVAFGGSEVLARTVAFDHAEAESANLTQTNMVTVSSFNGLQGLLIGYDLLHVPLCPHPLFGDCRLFDAGPLFDVTKALLGTVSAQRFPIAPGQHTLCAAKWIYAEGPSTLYGALAIAIPHDPHRNADLFLEDHGTVENAEDPDEAQGRILGGLINAASRIGANLNVSYEHIFLGFRMRTIPEGFLGCALTAAPYLRLARRAVAHQNITTLFDTNCSSWLECMGAYKEAF